IHTMKRTLLVIGAASLVLVNVAAQQQQQQQQQPPPAGQPPSQPQQPTEISTTISSDQAGLPPRFAVPDFIPPASEGGASSAKPDAEVADAARTIGRVLWDDLNFEREFALIPRDVYATVPAAKSVTDVPFDRWRELNADGVIVGTVRKTAAGVRVEVRLF